MASKDQPNCKRRRDARVRANVLRDKSIQTRAANTSMVMVVAHLAQLVRAGRAEWRASDTGGTEVRFDTGEVFLLGATAVTRLG